MAASSSASTPRPAHERAAAPSRSRAVPGLAALALIVLFALVAAAPASALEAAPREVGQAASGELFFYPCTSCHPVPAKGPRRRLPNGFAGHEVALVGHDALGRGKAACLVCHDDPARDPAKLKLADGGLIDIKGDVARVCYRCHSAKYLEWKAGTHGKGQPRCTASGCHDPHTPAWIYAPAVRPFAGSGFQFKALAERRPFPPLASPAPDPAVKTPPWLTVFAVLGMAAAAGQAARSFRGRPRT